MTAVYKIYCKCWTEENFFERGGIKYFELMCIHTCITENGGIIKESILILNSDKEVLSLSLTFHDSDVLVLQKFKSKDVLIYKSSCLLGNLIINFFKAKRFFNQGCHW